MNILPTQQIQCLNLRLELNDLVTTRNANVCRCILMIISRILTNTKSLKK